MNEMIPEITQKREFLLIGIAGLEFKFQSLYSLAMKSSENSFIPLSLSVIFWKLKSKMKWYPIFIHMFTTYSFCIGTYL